MCEVFPKMAACRYQRYGMGGREDNRHAICILGLNMINDKVFIVLWVWHCFICTVGTMRIFTRARYCRAPDLKVSQQFCQYLHIEHFTNTFFFQNEHWNILHN